MSNRTEKTPDIKALTYWHDLIVSRGGWNDGAFFHWHIMDWSYLVERCTPIGEPMHFVLYREGPCHIVVK